VRSAILGYKWNGWFVRTTHLREVLLQTRENCTENAWNAQNSFRRQCQGPLHVRRKRSKLGRTSRACWWSFLTVRALFTSNLFLQAKRWTSVTTWTFRSVWGKKSTENVRNDGGTRTGCFTMTMRRFTLLCLCSNFWPLKKSLWSPTLLTRLIWSLAISSCFREWNWS
jgi:hypothetical protein